MRRVRLISTTTHTYIQSDMATTGNEDVIRKVRLMTNLRALKGRGVMLRMVVCVCRRPPFRESARDVRRVKQQRRCEEGCKNVLLEARMALLSAYAARATKQLEPEENIHSKLVYFVEYRQLENSTQSKL